MPLGVPAIIAIAVGSASMVIAAACGILIARIRWRQKHNKALETARLSHQLEGHSAINWTGGQKQGSDGSGNRLRKSPTRRYMIQHVPSRESLSAPLLRGRPSREWMSAPVFNGPEDGVQVTRPVPIMRMKSNTQLHLSPIIERRTAEHSPDASLKSLTMEDVMKARKTFDGSPLADGATLVRQPRSISGSIVGDMSLNRQWGRVGAAANTRDQDVPKSILKRSQSLQRRSSGPVPSVPLPLPPKLVPRQGATGSSLRSLGSMASVRGSAFDDAGHSSLGETNESTLSYPAPLRVRDKRSPMIFDEHSGWNWSRFRAQNNSPAVQTSDSIRPPFVTLPSFEGDIEQCGLVRNKSSGLSMSLLDKNFTPVRQGCAGACDPGHDVFTSPTRPSSTRSASGRKRARSPLDRMSSLSTRKTSGDETYVNPALCETSGNRGSVLSTEQKDPPAADSDRPFKWDGEVPMRPGRRSSMKPRKEGHRRSETHHISWFMPVTPPGLDTTIEEGSGEGTSRYSKVLPGLLVTKLEASLPTIRPPSSDVFDPRLNLPTPERPASPKQANHYDSDPQPSPSVSALSTPTRKPPARRSAFLQKPNQPTGNAHDWPILVPSPPSRPPLALEPCRLTNPLALSPPDSPFGTSFPTFPAPPNPTGTGPSWRHPTSPYGPRPPPAVSVPSPSPRRLSTHAKAPRRRTHNRSPLRQMTCASATPSPSAVDLCALTAQLRRTNSEVSQPDSPYFRLGVHRNPPSATLLSLPESRPTPAFLAGFDRRRTDPPVPDANADADEDEEPAPVMQPPPDPTDCSEGRLSPLARQMMREERESRRRQQGMSSSGSSGSSSISSRLFAAHDGDVAFGVIGGERKRERERGEERGRERRESRTPTKTAAGWHGAPPGAAWRSPATIWNEEVF